MNEYGKYIKAFNYPQKYYPDSIELLHIAKSRIENTIYVKKKLFLALLIL